VPYRAVPPGGRTIAMSERRGWGSTVLGWFVVQDGPSGEAVNPASAAPDGQTNLPPPDVGPVGTGEAFFQKAPPSAPGGNVDFDKVFDAAGIDDEEQSRVTKAVELLKSLPAETPVGVRKQIVEASLKAFGVPIEKIIEAGVAEIQALEGYIRVGDADSKKLQQESEQRIRQYEDEIKQIRAVAEDRVREQDAVVRACNDKKLSVQDILEFFGQDAVARVVKASPKLRAPGDAPSIT
jgi:hypothetical protein